MQGYVYLDIQQQKPGRRQGVCDTFTHLSAIHLVSADRYDCYYSQDNITCSGRQTAIETCLMLARLIGLFMEWVG